MNSLYREILFLFFVIIIANIASDALDGDYSIINHPVKVIGGTIVLSIIGGYFVNKAKERALKNKNKESESKRT